MPEQGRWLASVVRGHTAYYAVPANYRAVNNFRKQVIWHWIRALRRRSQRQRLNGKRMYRLVDRWLPPVRIVHPCRSSAVVPHADSVRGAARKGGPYRKRKLVRRGRPHRSPPGCLPEEQSPYPFDPSGRRRAAPRRRLAFAP